MKGLWPNIEDYCIDPSNLLEELDRAGDQQSSSRADLVLLHQVGPRAGTDGCFERDGILNLLVLGQDVFVGGWLAEKSSENIE